MCSRKTDDRVLDLGHRGVDQADLVLDADDFGPERRRRRRGLDGGPDDDAQGGDPAGSAQTEREGRFVTACGRSGGWRLGGGRRQGRAASTWGRPGVARTGGRK